MSGAILKMMLSLGLPLLVLVTACSAGPVMGGPDSPHQTEATTAPSSQAPTTGTSSYTTLVFHGKEVFFPRTKYSGGPGPLALGHGDLVVDGEGCIRMKPTPNDPGFVLMWPSDYDLNAEGDKLQILDGKGKVVAQVGEEVSVGGGEVGVQRDIVDARTAHELRNRCPGGGYWVVTSVEAGTVRPLGEPTS